MTDKPDQEKAPMPEEVIVHREALIGLFRRLRALEQTIRNDLHDEQLCNVMHPRVSRRMLDYAIEVNHCSEIPIYWGLNCTEYKDGE